MQFVSDIQRRHCHIISGIYYEEMSPYNVNYTVQHVSGCIRSKGATIYSIIVAVIKSVYDLM